jgi:hypothetical protein
MREKFADRLVQVQQAAQYQPQCQGGYDRFSERCGLKDRSSAKGALAALVSGGIDHAPP